MKMLTKLKSHLKDNTGSAYMEKMVLIAIAFVIGGLLLTLLYNATHSDTFREGMGHMIENMFNW